MIVGYSKIGRSFNLDLSKASVAGGDIDVIRTLCRLAKLYPDDTFLILGRNTGEKPQDVRLPDNVVNLWTPEFRETIKQRTTPRGSPMTEEQVLNVLSVYAELIEPWFIDCEHQIVWAGQHGTSNTPLPSIKKRDTVTRPQDAFVLYCSFILNGLNRWRAQDPIGLEEIWLCPDPRNYLKFRDGAWPWRHPVIAQYAQVRQVKHERYGDPKLPQDYGFDADRAWYDPDEPGIWKSKNDYTYGALELTALPEPSNVPFPDLALPRFEFGLISNENRANVSTPRSQVVKTWVVDQFPEAPIFGIWSKKGMELLGRTIEPLPYPQMLPTMAQFRATCTFPASGSRWATAKPWEAFAVGTVCFFHPKYDEQNHILTGLPEDVINFLRVPNAEHLVHRVKQLSNDFNLYKNIAQACRQHYENRFEETHGGVVDIMRRFTKAPAYGMEVL